MTDRIPTELETIRLFSKHLVGLSLKYQSLNTDGTVHHEGYTVISGFILDIFGAWHWVTAGHCLTDLDELIAARKLRILSSRFVDYFGSHSASREPVPHTYEPGEATAYYQSEVGLDGAFIPLNELEQAAIASNDVVPIGRDNWINLLTTPIAVIPSWVSPQIACRIFQ